ncbi:GNAT family N-acetyltransferase, partial [Escherichia coli]
MLKRHPWVFESSIARGGGDSGETVRVESADGAFLCWAAFSPQSQIRLRAWSFDEAERIVGVSRIITNPDQTSCEFSLLVADDFGGKGLGSRLMEGITDAAREKGLSDIEGLV